MNYFESWARKATAYRSRLAPRSHASLIESIDKMALEAKKLSDTFKKIEIPSQEESNAFTQEITRLNNAIDSIPSIMDAPVGSALTILNPVFGGKAVEKEKSSGGKHN